MAVGLIGDARVTANLANNNRVSGQNNERVHNDVLGWMTSSRFSIILGSTKWRTRRVLSLLFLSFLTLTLPFLASTLDAITPNPGLGMIWLGPTPVPHRSQQQNFNIDFLSQK